MRALAALRTRSRVFRRNDYLRGEATAPGRAKDITWLRLDGREMVANDWSEPEHAAIAFRLDGGVGERTGAHALGCESFLVVMNGERGAVPLTLPARELGEAWRVVLDTREPPRIGQVVAASAGIEVDAGSVLVLVAG
jgi:pullulanase/glycogen debranching enzyme